MNNKKIIDIDINHNFPGGTCPETALHINLKEYGYRINFGSPDAWMRIASYSPKTKMPNILRKLLIWVVLGWTVEELDE